MLIRVVCFWKFGGSPANTGDPGGSRAIRKANKCAGASHLRNPARDSGLTGCFSRAHFFTKRRHFVESHERIRVAVQYKYFGYDRIPFGTDRRAQNAVYRNHGAKRGASTHELERTATADAIPDGRDTVLSTFRPAAKCTKPGGETERGAHFGGPVGEFCHASMSADFILLFFWTPSAHFGLNRMR